MSLVHDYIKIKYTREGYLPDYPYHMISDDEMIEAFMKSDSDEGFFFDNYYVKDESLKEQYEKYGIDLKLIYKVERPKNILNRNRMVLCVETGEVFENSTACATKLQCSRQAVSAAIRDGFAVRGKHLFMLGDTYELSKLSKERGRKTYPVVDTVNGRQWKSVAECAASYGVKESKVRYYIKIGKPMPDGAVLVFNRSSTES